MTQPSSLQPFRLGFRCLLATPLLAFPLAAQAPACGDARSAPTAEALVDRGRFWHAEQVVAPLPRAPRPVAPALGLTHARIRAGLGRWREVRDVLRRVPGGDSIPEIVALEAAAAEQLGDWPSAEARYRRLAELPAAPTALRVPALARRASALEMLGRDDSAAVAWRVAAQAVPEIADWFAIERAAHEPDTSLAFASLASPRSPGAASRSDLLAAKRREDAGNLAGALELYRHRNRPVDVARIEYALGERGTARSRADSVLLSDPSRPQALLAANLLAAQREALTAEELAGIARVYRAQNDLRAAVRSMRLALQRADTGVTLWLGLSALLAERRDRLGALAAADSAERRARRLRAGPEVLARIAVARVSALAAARAWEAADRLLGRAVSQFAGDTAVARSVLLLAEHDRVGDEEVSEARRYQVLLDRFASAPAANVARFRIALDLYVRGRRDSAAAVLADVVARDDANVLGTAPRYWDARLRLERGDSAGRGALRRIAAKEPLSWYGVRSRRLAGERLDFLPDTLPPGSAAEELQAARTGTRIRLLMLAGLEQEARDEALGWLGDPAATGRLLAAAAAAAGEAGLGPQAILLGEAARARAGLTAEVARGLLPLPYRGVIDGEAAEQCLDPMLLAAVIRQESRFTPKAVSRAGARGMAQVLPPTGRVLARRLGIRGWDPALLFVPDFNLHLGALLVRQRIRGEVLPEYAAIAAYNIGAPRVDRWRGWPQFRDPDLFVERIAISETRNYVKTVYASYQWYRRLYAAPGGRDSPEPSAPPPS
jgi:soluble lytic murein transglycosylase